MSKFKKRLRPQYKKREKKEKNHIKCIEKLKAQSEFRTKRIENEK